MSTQNFIKGLHSDFPHQNQPKDTYRSAKNWVRGLDGTLTNENGTSLTVAGLPEKKVVGSSVINDDIVLLFEGSSETGEIGWVRDDVYTKFKNVAISDARMDTESRVDYLNRRIVYFVNGIDDDRVVNLDIPTYYDTDIESKLRLDIISKLPEVEIGSIDESGNLPTGVYQFSARLLTASGNKAAISFPTYLLPITNESYDSDRKQFDGALPQTSGIKAVNLSISNIDTTFKFIEYIVTTYIGLGNEPKSYVIGRQPIRSTTSTFRYNSFDQHGEELTLDEVTIDPIYYDKSKHIESKDGRLLRANMTAKKYNVDFQKVANQIVAKYTVTNKSFSDNIDITWADKSPHDGLSQDVGTVSLAYNDYKSETISMELKSFRRKEVYSLSISPIFTDYSVGEAYHIPAKYFEDYTPANTITKELGTYVSGEVYPDDVYEDSTRVYPVGAIRHHVMPTMFQESIYDNTTNEIRILGIELSNIDLSVLGSDASKVIGYVVGRQVVTEGNRSILTQGIAQNLFGTGTNVLTVSPFEGKEDWNHSGDIFYTRNYVAFYSPESVIYQDNFKVAEKIVPVGHMNGKNYLSHKEDNTVMVFSDYKNFYGDAEKSGGVLKASSNIDRNTIQYIPADNGNFTYKAENITEPFSTAEVNGYLFFKTNTDLDIYYDDTIKADITYENVGSSDVVRMRNGGSLMDSDSLYAIQQYGDTSRFIYNLERTLLTQYGRLDEAEYIYCGHHIGSDTTINITNGDTFIGKIAVMSTTGTLVTSNDSVQERFRTMNYFMCESSINMNYRHYIQPTEENNNQGTLPYFPKYKTLYSSTNGDGLFQIHPGNGHSRGYNKQYSFANSLKKYYPKDLLNEGEQTDFKNRVIYSEMSVEGEQFDSQRVFLPNNYHDIPNNKGEISDLFVHNGSLYIHTPKSLFKAYMNEKTTQATSSGEVVLGNGGLFPLPSEEIFANDGGYAGSSEANGSNSPFGRFWLDRNQSKFFMLTDTVKEVSIGISNYLKTRVATSGVYISIYDFENRRWIFSAPEFTLSYMPELESFTCNHSYQFSHGVSKGNRLFLVNALLFHEANVGVKANYFDSQNSSEIGVIINHNPLVTKVFDNLLLDTSVSFNEFECSNNLITSNPYTLVDTHDFDYEPAIFELISKLKPRLGQYQIAIPRGYDEDEEDYTMRFKSKWLLVNLEYTNLDTMNFKYLTTLARESK